MLVDYDYMNVCSYVKKIYGKNRDFFLRCKRSLFAL